MKKFLPCLLLSILVTSCKNEPKPEGAGLSSQEGSVLHEIALANGINNFDELSKLGYTFNVKINDSLVSQRSWEWNLDSSEATLKTTDTSITYNYKKQAKQYPEIDQKFINDQYWLLFPFHLVWDELDFQYQEKAQAPISGKELQHVVISYPKDAGYTPGDVYEIYFDDNYIIREWIYRSGGSSKNPLVTSWEDYREFNGVKIATMHKDPEGVFTLYFTNIEVE